MNTQATGAKRPKTALPLSVPMESTTGHSPMEDHTGQDKPTIADRQTATQLNPFIIGYHENEALNCAETLNQVSKAIDNLGHAISTPGQNDCEFLITPMFLIMGCMVAALQYESDRLTQAARGEL